MWIFLETVV